MAHIGRGKLRKIIDSLIVESNINRDWTPFHSRQRGNYFRGWVNDNISQDEIEAALEGFPDTTLDRSGSHTNAYIRQAWRIFGEEFLDSVAPERETAVRSRERRPWPFPSGNTREGRDAIKYYERLSLQNRSILGMMAYTFLSVIENLSNDLVRERNVSGGSVYPSRLLVVPEDWGFGGRHHHNASPGVYSFFSYLDGETRNIGKYWLVYGNWRPGEQLRFYLYTASTNGDGEQFISDVFKGRPVVSFEVSPGTSDSEISRRLANAIVEDMGLNEDEENSEDEERSRDMASVEP
tara:strand:- start:360 stop:1241 length:882 start_codon:yes stop_codon:yes gene_type:complete